MAAPPLTARRSWWAMALPTARPEFDFPEVLDCSCGTRLRVGRRRYRARDFTMAGMIALTWGTVCLLTAMVFKYPVFCWMFGIFVTIIPLILSGAGKHGIKVVAESDHLRERV